MGRPGSSVIAWVRDNWTDMNTHTYLRQLKVYLQDTKTLLNV